MYFFEILLEKFYSSDRSKSCIGEVLGDMKTHKMFTFCLRLTRFSQARTSSVCRERRKVSSCCNDSWNYNVEKSPGKSLTYFLHSYWLKNRDGTFTQWEWMKSRERSFAYQFHSLVQQLLAFYHHHIPHSAPSSHTSTFAHSLFSIFHKARSSPLS